MSVSPSAFGSRTRIVVAVADYTDTRAPALAPFRAPALSSFDDAAVRDCAEDDLVDIGRIWNAEINDSFATWSTTPHTREDLTAWRAAKRQAGLPILVTGTPVAGFATWGPFRRGDGYAATVEHSVYVDRQGRGRGIGTVLLKALIRRAVLAGVSAMVGGIDAEQEASLALHRRLGFIEVGRLPGIGRKFGSPRTLVLMQRALERDP